MRAGRGRGERGAVMAFYAVAMVPILLSVALVVDLGQLRVVRRTDKGITDVAARAGVARLALGPWSGVCKARDYLLGNARAFSSFDAGSETWSNAADPPVTLSSSPCPARTSSPDPTPCSPGAPASWAKLRATASGGRITVEIQSGYALPDARFTEDASTSDNGAPDQGSCDNLAVIVTERTSPWFAQVGGAGPTTTRVRSVARLNTVENRDNVAALQLLEQHKCGVLQTGGTNTRVVAKPYQGQPGIIQIDSADDAGTCSQPIVNGQATNSGPSILACNVTSSRPECAGGVGTRQSQVGVYALNFNRPPGDIASAFPTTYGETPAVASPRAGRRAPDIRYRRNVIALESSVKSMLGANGGLPPGCGVVVANSCTGNGVTWLVLQRADCTNAPAFFAAPSRATAPYVWINCDLNVTSPLTLSGPASTVVVTGQLAVNSTFAITDPRAVYVGGRASGNKIGLDVGGPGTVFSVNLADQSRCSARTGPGHAATLVVGDGSLNVSSGATMRACQTFVDLASGFDKVPSSDNTPPCSSPCSSYLGTVNVASGAFVDWSAPNEITGRPPSRTELSSTNRFEDVALWTEAGSATNGIAGGSDTNLSGVYFLPNADPFTLSGGGSLPIYLSAQFIATSMKVTGGATVNLVPTPTESVAPSVSANLLVR